MKPIEEQIWEYIDGFGTPEERQALQSKIDNDAAYTTVYTEMKELHELMAATELEEPSMSFTRNIMDKVALEIPPVSLKTKVDTRIIYSLAAIFILAIMFVFGYAIANSTFTFRDVMASSFEFTINLKPIVNPLTLQTFLFIDIILALLYLDRLYRSKNV